MCVVQPFRRQNDVEFPGLSSRLDQRDPDLFSIDKYPGVGEIAGYGDSLVRSLSESQAVLEEQNADDRDQDASY